MAGKKTKFKFNPITALGMVAVVAMCIMMFLPFFTYQTTLGSSTIDRGESSGFDAVFSLFSDDSANNSDSTGFQKAVALHDADGTGSSMQVLAFAGLAAFMGALLLLVVEVLSMLGKIKIGALAKFCGGLAAGGAALTFILGIVVAGAVEDNAVLSIFLGTAKIGVGMILFLITGLAAGAVPFLVKNKK